ncbi:MAG: ribonuclease R [Vicinamibacteria bacterium]|nr:ribonuclease R [Vicinamibacteria bacterium]
MKTPIKKTVRSSDTFFGRVVGHPAGFAFVNPIPGGPDSPPHPTLKVDLPLLHGASHGDTVMARVVGKTDKGFSGEVVKVVEHAVKRVVGRYEVSRGHAHVVPFDRRLFQNVQAQSADLSMKVESGDMVVLKITRPATANRLAAGEVTERLGRIDDPGVDLKVILAQYQLTDEFPAAVVAETEAEAATVPVTEIAKRADFTGWTTITIDPETAKDHDDAISIARHSNGNFVLAVHIADVAHYVREGSALDACAYERGNSVYFPGFVVPMLPHALSSRICSLVEGEVRLTQSAVMEIDHQGQVKDAQFYDGVIKSVGKLAYKDAQAILDGDPATRARFAHAVKTVEESRELAVILNQARKDRGSLDFDLPEPELQLNPLGVVENITSNPRLFAMRMIEEFMLVANEAVAKALSQKDVATLYRIHESPDPDRLEEYLELVRTFGYQVTADLEHPQGRDFQRILRQVEGRPEERLLTYLMLRTQRLARYAPENLGHFGLASENYLHFTSPIRRYPDLVAHRALRALRHGKNPAAVTWPLEEMAAHLGETERKAADAERDLIEWKKARFMSSRVGETFQGVISSVTPFGLFVQLADIFVEGLVHIATMSDDYYIFRDTDHALRGERTKRTYKLGDRVEVQLIKVDMDRRQINLALTAVLKRMQKPEVVQKVQTARRTLRTRVAPAPERAPARKPSRTRSTGSRSTRSRS